MRAFYKNSQMFWRKVKMPNTLIVYSSVDGHTKKICDKIEMTIANSDRVETVSIDDVYNKDLVTYDKIIIGASIRYGNYRPSLFQFITDNKKILESKMSAFFSVNIVARKPEKSSSDTNPYMKKFLKKSSWEPNYLGVFAGRLDFPNYKFTDKYIIKFIMWMTKGPTDTTKTYEFTDWDGVDAFAKKLIS